MAADRLMGRIAAAALVIAVVTPGAAFAQATAPVVVPLVPEVDPNDKVRCRRIYITGSLVKSEKVCKTVGEWRRLSDRGNDVVRDQANAQRMCSGGDVICSGN